MDLCFSRKSIHHKQMKTGQNPVYEEFKKFTNNQIEKELEKTESFDDVELPPEMPVV